MNDYDRMPHLSHIGTIPHYPISGDRNAPLSVSHANRPDFRGCPVSARSRSTNGREFDTEPGGGQPRRRIAVACQFHRVGSGDAYAVINMAGPVGGPLNNAIPVPNMNQNAMLPIYSANSPIYPRAYTNNHYPTLTTKTIYPQNWTSIPYTDDSPIENYGLGPALQTQDSLNSLYGTQESLRWNQGSHKTIGNGNGTGIYLDQDTSPAYTANGLPYLTTPMSRQPVCTEGFSPLSMTSLSSTLPVPLNDRQLPIPHQSTISRSSANVVDQMHMRSLPSSQGTSTNGINSNGTYTKAAMAWANEGSATTARPSSITSSSSGEIVAPRPSKSYASATSSSEGVLGYIAVTAGSSPEPSPTSTAPSLTYSTPSSLDSMPAPTLNGSFSAYRNSGISHASSSEALLTRHDSCSNLYTFSADSSSKRNSLGDGSSTEGTLVSGQRYAPLRQPQHQHTASMEALRRNSFDQRAVPTHRSSVSSLNRNF
ncbi:hypothetical protein K432DRAFT_413028 [Lepidopterella palustris CBS 459.81]|uniref:Uncharacterized protein n=1 Tax=Lepidopterella palustris CBS 459.81 TaxID=1314670 RepID=A0A8E2JKL4_9PEZI|nr:hypothetical protein K432DRAFT_413028 [Lepidopterella palustris CBS 459.81]